MYLSVFSEAPVLVREADDSIKPGQTKATKAGGRGCLGDLPLSTTARKSILLYPVLAHGALWCRHLRRLGDRLSLSSEILNFFQYNRLRSRRRSIFPFLPAIARWCSRCRRAAGGIRQDWSSREGLRRG